MLPNKEGTNLGSYRIVSQAGKGGMATVYKAYQTSMERFVALKVLSPQHLQDPDFTKRFIREARTIAQLEHRNILPVYDFGENDGVTYMAMRYLETGTLQDILSSKLSLYDIIDIMHQICAGLDYAHRQSVVHRDIKPANVMLDNEGAVYLTDFGLAKALEGSTTLTASGVIMGTPRYMAPEQSTGEEIDGRADIYSAGIILYEMVTGRVPFQNKTPLSVIMAHINEPLPPPRTINADLPIEVEDIILKALEKNPDDRYQTAKEMSEALEQTRKELDLQKEDASLILLTTKVKEEIESKTILPTQEGFTPIPGRVTTAEPVPLSKKGILLRARGVIALLTLVVFLGITFLGNRESQPSSETNPPAEAVLYDDFNDSQDVDTSKWEILKESTCQISQEGGELVVTNESSHEGISDCDLIVRQPEAVSLTGLETLEANIYLSSDFSGEAAGQGLMYSVNYPNEDTLYIICGPEAVDREFIAQLWIARVTEYDTLEKYYASTKIEADSWNSYRLELNKNSGEVTCLIDDAVAGRYTLGDFSDLEYGLYQRGLTAWRGENSFATTKVDDFTLIP